ncbi:GntR family transcriptional regulator [Paracoccus sp. PAR01]|uniref:GntR family transcriptional regulator n=1 Tax=Paracoccus sp. PAR01 TaxID=2769282 RepID=UPI001782CAB7|nr:GntR family transcriptional regulator [Paracoccus sp. PAR01]MBD9527548.1 GntR family transcriptional regulator [Paracoccus sp. PAR01]
MLETVRNEPSHLNIYRRVRQMVLTGDVAPGQPITIQGLVALTEGGVTQVREAIRRLVSEGALQTHDNRRVSVPVLRLPQLDELCFARVALEPDLARRAALRIDETGIVQLEQIDDMLDDAMRQGSVHGYMLHNYRFHNALYAHARTEILQDMVEMLWLRTAPALRVMCGRFGTSNLPDMHRAAIDALRRRDPDAVAEAIRSDILQGMENVRSVLTSGTDN